ncbi:predicted GPI-anchored protein 58, partial [Austrofundulus limnaeus]|uniref:Predicted GPI-anchored protein 58 n=1 Tax=Austrofundulus limnaeus TaxID=52670 RepID=A0A2I4D1B4_AUSLI
ARRTARNQDQQTPLPRAAQTPKTRPPAPQPTGSPKKLPKPSKSDLAESAHPATDNARRDQGQAPPKQRGQPAGPAQPATATTAIRPAPSQKKYYTHPIIQTTHRTYSTLDTQAGLACPLPPAPSPANPTPQLRTLSPSAHQEAPQREPGTRAQTDPEPGNPPVRPQAPPDPTTTTAQGRHAPRAPSPPCQPRTHPSTVRPPGQQPMTATTYHLRACTRPPEETPQAPQGPPRTRATPLPAQEPPPAPPPGTPFGVLDECGFPMHL